MSFFFKAETIPEPPDSRNWGFKGKDNYHETHDRLMRVGITANLSELVTPAEPAAAQLVGMIPQVQGEQVRALAACVSILIQGMFNPVFAMPGFQTWRQLLAVQGP